jgi:2',3'-cyclic-nucleotide 2'-phosphodiesterase (5'-nucleotidase family)
MRLSRCFATLTVAVALTVAPLGATGTAEAQPRAPKPNEVQLQVLSFNDFHGHLQPPGDKTLGPTLDPNARLATPRP